VLGKSGLRLNSSQRQMADLKFGSHGLEKNKFFDALGRTRCAGMLRKERLRTAVGSSGGDDNGA
jgi:uncharacterized membrane protein YqiK